MILLVTPPLTQLNTPYPATSQLKPFLDREGFHTEQVDLGIELIDRIFRKEFLKKAFPAGHPASGRYADIVDAVMCFLRGEDPSLATRIANSTLLPESKRIAGDDDMDWWFGNAGTEDKARYMATLFLEDLAEYVRNTLDPHFELVRYAEHICTYAETFDKIALVLEGACTPVEDVMLELLEKHIKELAPTLVGFTVPFPGCLIPALRCGQYIKKHYKDITVCLGGGFPNTEWRRLREPRLFDYVDYVTLDDGELPMLRLAQMNCGRIDEESLLRTFCRKDGKVVYISKEADGMPTQVKNDDLPSPDFSGLPLDKYISTADMGNPMQRLWSCGRWNKMMMAHGCYWAKCAFCDTTLDYIGRYDAPSAQTVVDHMEHIMSQTRCSGFHFVDEAMPPKLLREVCQEIIRRGLVVSFWGNIRFEKVYSREMCELMSSAGCIAVSGGLEVASDRLLELIGKGVSVQQTIDATRNFRDAGIMVHTYLMYGFPTETLAETIDALENVRYMFDENMVQSAFWHRYAMTVHSPSGCNPNRYGALCPGRVGDNLFCNNEIPFEYDFGYDLDAVGDILRIATYNYMNGRGLDQPAYKWFSRLKKNKSKHKK